MVAAELPLFSVYRFSYFKSFVLIDCIDPGINYNNNR